MMKYISAIALILTAPVIAKQEAVASSEVDKQTVSSNFDLRMFAEFKSICSDISSLEAISTSAIKSDWLSYQVPERSIHAKSLAGLTSLLASKDIQILNFTKKITGKDIILSLSHVMTKEDNVISCRMHDYSAIGPIDSAVIKNSLDREPDIIKEDANLTILAWIPGLNLQHSQLKMIYTPPESPLVNELNFKGVILIAQQ